MNKNECKKYLRRAFWNLEKKNKDMTPKNLEIEMEREIRGDGALYIAYGKIAMHLLNKSATEITAKQLETEIDTIPSVYSDSEIILKSKNL